MKKHEIGTTPRLLCEFLADGVAYDPNTIELKIKEPDGTITTKAIGNLTSNATGTWYYAFTVSQEGLHSFRYVGAGPTYDIAAVGHFKGTDVIGS